jgi:hypothetical protein
MISIKQYLDQAPSEFAGHGSLKTAALLPLTLAAYRSALSEMGSCGLDACPALGQDLKQGLNYIAEELTGEISCETIAETEARVQKRLQDWSRSAALHNRKQAGEVKEILLVMARTAESVGDRDQRCAQQINEVTTRLNSIANLEDLTEIRESIKRSASELKSSIDRIAAESKAVLDHLRCEVSAYQIKLEKAEQIAERDSLTGLGSRLWVETQIEQLLDTSTLTSSKKSMTSTAIWSEMNCSSSLPPRCAPFAARRTCLGAGAAMSSCSCSTIATSRRPPRRLIACGNGSAETIRSRGTPASKSFVSTPPLA